MNVRDTLIVLSGGMDSVTLLHEYASRIALAVTFDYGSNHNQREAECAKEQCRRLDIPWKEVKFDLKGLFRSSLLEGADAIPTGEYDSNNIRSTVVPFRNGIMLAVAAGIAESEGLQYVMLANHAGDHEIYPDCRPEFVEAMDKAICAGTFPGIRLLAPYTRLTKADIARRGKDLGVDYGVTYSCYKGGDIHCGECATCRERKQALQMAGIADPTQYLVN